MILVFVIHGAPSLPGISASVLLEAGKAVMRGKIISFSSHNKKREFKDLKIKSSEDAYSTNLDEQILNRIRKDKPELD